MTGIDLNVKDKPLTIVLNKIWSIKMKEITCNHCDAKMPMITIVCRDCGNVIMSKEEAGRDTVIGFLIIIGVIVLIGYFVLK